MTDHHTPSGANNIEEDEICYLPLDEVKKLSQVHPSSESISQGPLNFSPKRSYLARIKKKTEHIKWDFCKLLENFCETLSKTTNDENFSRRCCMISTIFSIDPKTRDEIKAGNNVEKLKEKIYEHQSFMNFDILINKLIQEFGSEQDKIKADNYIDSFKEYAKCRVSSQHSLHIRRVASAYNVRICRDCWLDVQNKD